MLTDILQLKGLKMTIIILKKNNKMCDFEIKKSLKTAINKAFGLWWRRSGSNRWPLECHSQSKMPENVDITSFAVNLTDTVTDIILYTIQKRIKLVNVFALELWIKVSIYIKRCLDFWMSQQLFSRQNVNAGLVKDCSICVSEPVPRKIGHMRIDFLQCVNVRLPHSAPRSQAHIWTIGSRAVNVGFGFLLLLGQVVW